MPVIQSATVEFGRTVKPADFESIPVRVVLTGLVNNDADLALLGDMAYVECMRLLGRELERRGFANVASRGAPAVEPAPPPAAEPAKRTKHHPVVIGEPKVEPTPAPQAAPEPALQPAAEQEDFSEMSNEDLKKFLEMKYAEATSRHVPPAALREVITKHVMDKNLPDVYALKGEARHAFVLDIRGI